MEKNKRDIGWGSALEVFSEVSTWIAIPVVLALIGGKALDNHFGTSPILLLVFAGFGFLISSYGIVKAVKKYSAKIKKDIDKDISENKDQ